MNFNIKVLENQYFMKNNFSKKTLQKTSLILEETFFRDK